ncbi:uncharacterized protein LOC106661328 [Cimex lectularius]|uniref:Uncharacterized protein n=1 Tax=Cimex lectularius TaxID=79782 RepID=A0A8I6R6W8_CIMLE|nr:uncharacterized protein LOC106661328 [Cimex lectularius]
MGVTDWKLMTFAGNENFRKACEKEADSRYYWVEKWGWITKEIIDVNTKMLELKAERANRRESLELKRENEESSEEIIVLQDPCPFPDTTNHEYGWLHQYKDWNLEKFGPFPLMPLKARTSFTKEEIDDMIELKKKERRNKRRNLMKHN